MNLYSADEMGKGDSYVAPDSHFINSISLFTASLPWEKFETFFKNKQLVNISANEQLMMLRLLALQESLCLDDDDLLQWARQQLCLLSFMQPGVEARLPSKELLVEFRQRFDDIGLLKPFRKQCQRLIKENDMNFPPIQIQSSPININETTATKKHNKKHRLVSDMKVDLPNTDNLADIQCPNCGSQNVIHLTPSQEASTLPNIRFSRCRFCGNTFRD